MTTEDAIHAALDRDPGDAMARLALADWLDENAVANPCDKCHPAHPGRVWTGIDGMKWIPCPTCHGTGTVSDGRRERAAGYRALAACGFRPQHLRPVPDNPIHDHWMYQCLPFHKGDWYGAVRHTFDLNNADEEAWFRAVEPRLAGCHSRSRREADDRFALAFGRLPADVQARILDTGVTT